MKKCLTKTILVMLFVTIAAFAWGQSIFYQEPFDSNVGWTLVPNWAIETGALHLSWSPGTTPYDMAALSPDIAVPANAGDLVISQYVDEYAGQGVPPETYEIAVMVGATPTVLWTYSTDSDWGVTGGTNVTLSLAPYAGQTIKLRFKSFGEDTFNFDNWYVYDIKAYASLAHDLSAVSLTGSIAPQVNTLNNYTLTVGNTGQNAEATYTVKLMKEGNVEIASLPGVSLAPGQTHEYTLPWTPTAVGATYLYGKVVTAVDDNANNNQTANLSVAVQPAGTAMIEIGTGTGTQRQPFGVYWGYERDATLFTSAEIGVNGALTSIKWKCATPAAAVVPYKIYLKSTPDATMTAVPWATMLTDATLALEGNYTFNAAGWVTFTLTNPFMYTGGNLLVMVETTYTGTGTATYPYFNYSVGPAATHQIWYQDTTAPTGNGTLNTNRPNIGLFFSTGGMGSITGIVLHDSTPLSGATVTVVGTQLTQTTGPAGTYNFPYVNQGPQTVMCSKVGYNTQTIPVTVVENQSSTANFGMVQLPVVNVTGHVVGSDAPTVGIEGATITLEGMAPYTATTNAAGNFTIAGVYSGQTYTYNLTKAGYSPATGTAVVGATDLNMGTLTVNEIALPATTVVATENGAHSVVNVTWSEPGTGGGEWIQWDTDENADQIGLTNGGTFDVASRWSVADLTDYVGMSLHSVKFYLGATTSIRVRVWTGGTAAAPGQMVIDQPYTTFTADDWNVVALATPVPIQAGQELWFGYSVTHAAGSNPAGCDAGPSHDGFGNMIYNGGAWSTLYTLAPTLNFDWNIAGYVGYSGPTRAAVRPTALKPIVLNEERTVAGTFTNKGTGSFTTSNVVRNDRPLAGYKVYRLFEGQETTEAAWTTLTPNTITALAFSDASWATAGDGTYKWAVKAAYAGNVMSIPAFSLPIVKLTQVGTISGIVRRSNNVAIAGATITSGTYTATSNATGAYTMSVPAGTRTVTCTAPTFEPSTQTGIVVVTGQNTVVNFTLQASAYALLESFEGATFPPTGWTQVITNTGAAVNGVLPTFCRVGTIALTPPIAPADGAWQVGLFWSETHQEEWLKSPVFACPNQAILKFNTYAEQASTHGDHYYVKVSTNGTAWTTLWDSTTLQPGDVFTDYAVPIEIDLSTYHGQNIQLAWHADDPTDNLGLWFVWFLDNVKVQGIVANDDPTPTVVVTALNGNYPNPFNPETTINYSVNSKTPVVVDIYNTKGQKVKTLVNETKAPGSYNVKWNGTDQNNQKVSNGVYFYKMNAGTYSASKKMILMK